MTLYAVTPAELLLRREIMVLSSEKSIELSLKLVSQVHILPHLVTTGDPTDSSKVEIFILPSIFWLLRNDSDCCIEARYKSIKNVHKLRT
jgi:hypothetical protein